MIDWGVESIEKAFNFAPKLDIFYAKHVTTGKVITIIE